MKLHEFTATVTPEASSGGPTSACVTALLEPPATLAVSKPVRSRLKLPPLLRDLALTIATEFGVVLAGLVLVSLFGRLFGPTDLGEFLLLRRVTAWLVAGMLLGMANALPRYIAHAAQKPEAVRRSYFLAASSCMLAFTLVATLTLYIGRNLFARWLFGDARHADLVLPLCLLLAGLAAQTAAYGYYRGILAMGRANAIQFFHFAVIPVAAVALLYSTRSVVLIVDVIGVLTVVAALWFAWPIFRAIARNPLPKLRPYVTELLKYGVPRVPGDFGGAALFALGPVIAAHYVSMTEVAYLLLGSNLLMVMGYAAGPLTIVLLSKFSMMLSQNRVQEVRTAVVHLVGATLDLSVFAALQIVVFADVLVGFWVGPKFLEAVPVVRLLILAAPPYLFYMALRSSIDSITVKPRNAGNILVALTVYLLLTGATLKFLPAEFLLEGIAGSLVVAFVVLGILTARTFEQLYHVRIPLGRCLPSLLVAVLLGAASFAFRWVQGFHVAPIMAVVYGILIAGLFLVGLNRLGSPWLRFVGEMAFPRLKMPGSPAKSQAT